MYITLKELKKRARYLRKRGTVGEKMLWNCLKSNNSGFKFTRQKILFPYIVDFCCPKLKLIIEIDGSSHDFKGDYDWNRQRILESSGYTFLRFTEKEVKTDIQSVSWNIDGWIEDHARLRSLTAPLFAPAGSCLELQSISGISQWW
jgi:very-short-patch-repair endonuclease